MLLARDKSLLLVRYELRRARGYPPAYSTKPLLAYRNIHALTRANPALRTDTVAVPGGFSIRPYESLPPLYIQAAGDSGKACSMAVNAEGAATSEKCGPHAAASFVAEPDWCRNVEYFEERGRGFDDSEDLFMPGTLEIALPSLPQGGYVCGGWHGGLRRKTCAPCGRRKAAPAQMPTLQAAALPGNWRKLAVSSA